MVHAQPADAHTALLVLTIIAALVWLGIIMALHRLQPELNPRFRMVSEYACHPGGWIMQFAFLAMALSCWALAAAMAMNQPPLGPALLFLCGIGVAATGIFVTDRVLPMEAPQTSSGALHVLFAFAVMLLFPVMATVVGANIAERATGSPIRPWLAVLIALPWLGLFSFVGAVFRARRNPKVPVGYFERFLIAAYTAWLIGMALALLR